MYYNIHSCPSCKADYNEDDIKDLQRTGVCPFCEKHIKMRFHNVQVCPECKSNCTEIINTRARKVGIIRYHQCKECGTSYKTVEMLFSELKAMKGVNI